MLEAQELKTNEHVLCFQTRKRARHEIPEARAGLILRLLYVPPSVYVCVCVCSSAIITCSKLRHSVTMPL